MKDSIKIENFVINLVNCDTYSEQVLTEVNNLIDRYRSNKQITVNMYDSNGVLVNSSES